MVKALKKKVNMTRDELVNLIQKLDQRGASEQEIATIVDSYRSEVSSPINHITDPQGRILPPNHTHEEETTTIETPVETETTPPQTTTIEHLTPEEFGLEGYEKAQSQATDKIG